MSKQFHGQPQHEDERRSLIGNSWNVTVVTWLLAQLGHQLGLCPLLTPQQAVHATAPGRSGALGGLLQRQAMRKIPKGPAQGEYDLVSKLLNLVSLKGEDIMVQAPTEETLRYHYPLTSSHLPTPQLLCVLNLYYQVASSHLPAPRLLLVLKLYYKVASSQLLPTHQFSSSHSPATLRTKVVLPSRHFSSSSSTATPRTKVVLRSRQFSASSSTDCSAY